MSEGTLINDVTQIEGGGLIDFEKQVHKAYFMGVVNFGSYFRDVIYE